MSESKPDNSKLEKLVIVDERNFLKFIESKFSKNEYVFIEKALNDCKIAHAGIFRDTGEAYYTHPLSIALIMINELRLFYYEAIISGLLHDTVEDEVSYWLGKTRPDNDINAKEIFDVGQLITEEYNHNISDAIFTLSKLKLRNRQGEIKKISIKSYITHLTGNELAVLVKACDRLHNLRTMPNDDTYRIDRYVEDTEKFLLPLYKKIIDKNGKYAKYLKSLLVKTEEEINKLQSRN